MFLGSSRSLLSGCKAYSVQIHTVVVTGSSPVAPTIFLKALTGSLPKAWATNLPQALHHLRGQTPFPEGVRFAPSRFRFEVVPD